MDRWWHWALVIGMCLAATLFYIGVFYAHGSSFKSPRTAPSGCSIVTTGNAQQYAAWCVTSTLPPRTSVVPR